MHNRVDEGYIENNGPRSKWRSGKRGDGKPGFGGVHHGVYRRTAEITVF